MFIIKPTTTVPLKLLNYNVSANRDFNWCEVRQVEPEVIVTDKDIINKKNMGNVLVLLSVNILTFCKNRISIISHLLIHRLFYFPSQSTMQCRTTVTFTFRPCNLESL
jgi:hypothetical protein